MPSLLLVLLTGPATLSCVSVPPEAVILSNVVGNQIAEHRASHEEFARRYFDRSRDVVELFLRDRWIPEYLERFTVQSQVMELLMTPDEVFGEGTMASLQEELLAISGIGEVRAPLIIAAVSRVIGGSERGQIMLDFAEVALAEIEAQRAELLEPIDAQEQFVLDHLAESYLQLQLAQTQLTAFLTSARKVTRSQDEVLEVMGSREIRDEALEKAMGLSERLAAAAKAGETAAEALEEMKAILSASGLDVPPPIPPGEEF